VPWSPSIAATKYFLFKTVASVFQDRVLNIPLQSTADQTDVDMVKEDRGRMMSTEYQVDAINVPLQENAVCCLSNIAGASTTDAPKLQGPGAQLALTCTYETNHGATAGEENVSQYE